MSQVPWRLRRGQNSRKGPRPNQRLPLNAEQRLFAGIHDNIYVIAVVVCHPSHSRLLIGKILASGSRINEINLN